MPDWGLIACAFGRHDWVPYPGHYHEDVMCCTRCGHLSWRHAAIERALRRLDREERTGAARPPRQEESP